MQTVDYFADVVAADIVYDVLRKELLYELTSLESIVLVMGIADPFREFRCPRFEFFCPLFLSQISRVGLVIKLK